jgi:undecaprenyl diphosphate synthase
VEASPEGAGGEPPDVLGWPWPEARRRLEEAGLQVRRRFTADPRFPPAPEAEERVVAVRAEPGGAEVVTAAFPPEAPAGGGPLPRHVAVIMDGNRRWAQQRGADTDAGHRAGVISLRGVVRVCSDLGIGYLTCYAFSTENWKRSSREVEGLWTLALEFLRTELPELIRRGVRVRVIGDRAGLPPLVRQAAAAAETATARNRGLVLTLALNYGARQEITAAARALCAEVAAGRLRPEDVDESSVAAHLATAGMPDPDLLIRTSGEHRVSNFLLWQIAYSEIWLTDALWPDFGEAELRRALDDYRRRDRRFGGGAPEAAGGS